MTGRTIPVDIPEDLYTACLVRHALFPSSEHPVVAALRHGLAEEDLEGAGGAAIQRWADKIHDDLDGDPHWTTAVPQSAYGEGGDRAGIETNAASEAVLEARYERQYGPRNGGVRWGPLFLPNTTRVRMVYKRVPHDAVVAHDTLRWRDKPYSPSEFAGAVAQGTARNAWRDLEIWCHPDNAWIPADLLRKDPHARRRLLHELDWEADKIRRAPKWDLSSKTEQSQ